MLIAMEWWKLGLEYLKVIIGWPLIILAIAIVLRKQIGGLLRRDLEAEAAGVRLRVGRAEEAAEEALEEATQVSLAEPDVDSELIEESKSQEITPDVGSSDSSERKKLSNEIAALEAKLGLEEDRRSALERVLSEGARLGWEWAKSGENQPPKLLVSWSGDGVPSVVTERKLPGPRSAGSANMEGFAYERRVLGYLEAMYPGSVRETHIDRSPFDAYIHTENSSIGIIVKYRRLNRLATLAVIRDFLVGIPKGLDSVVVVANFGITGTVASFLRDFKLTYGVNLHWIEWDGDLKNKALSEALERIIDKNPAAPDDSGQDERRHDER